MCPSINRCCLMPCSSIPAGSKMSYNFFFKVTKSYSTPLPGNMKFKTTLIWLNKLNRHHTAWHYLHNSGSVWTDIKSLDKNLKETLWTLPRLLEKPSTAACWRDWKWVCRTFLEVYLLGFVCVSCSECVCRTQEERREEDPLNNAVLLSASGCVCLWLVPWTALLAVAHCTCTYCWRGRERRERERGEGGAVRRSQARQTVCVSV